MHHYTSLDNTVDSGVVAFSPVEFQRVLWQGGGDTPSSSRSGKDVSKLLLIKCSRCYSYLQW